MDSLQMYQLLTSFHILNLLWMYFRILTMQFVEHDKPMEPHVYMSNSKFMLLKESLKQTNTFNMRKREETMHTSSVRFESTPNLTCASTVSSNFALALA